MQPTSGGQPSGTFERPCRKGTLDRHREKRPEPDVDLSAWE